MKDGEAEREYLKNKEVIMFNHDIELNYNLNRMGVAWFQQHSPKSVPSNTVKKTGSYYSKLYHSPATGDSITNHDSSHPSRTTLIHESSEGSMGVRNNRSSKSKVWNEITKPPKTFCQSKKLRKRPASCKKSREVEALELVDIIDIEDEDDSVPAFFIGMTKPDVPSSTIYRTEQEPIGNIISKQKDQPASRSHAKSMTMEASKPSPKLSGRLKVEKRVFSEAPTSNRLDGSIQTFKSNIILSANTIKQASHEIKQTTVNSFFRYLYSKNFKMIF